MSGIKRCLENIEEEKGSEVTEEEFEMGMKSITLFHEGKFRESFAIKVQLFGNMKTKTDLLIELKQSYIESKHQHYIAGAGGPSGSWNQPWCKCGWEGPKVKTYEEAKQIPCERKMTLVKNLAVEHLYHDSGVRYGELKYRGFLK